MPSVPPSSRFRGTGPQSQKQFAQSRARALRENLDHRNRAARTVASYARDREDFTGLLSMLGLEDGPGGLLVLSHALAGYVRQVAAAIGVPADAIGCEVSDTATAYVGLTDRWFGRPNRDLMLVWDERLGWYVGVETIPGETPVVVGYLGGDAVPPPATVARFVANAVAGHSRQIRPVLEPTDRTVLAKRMSEPNRLERTFTSSRPSPT